MTNYADMTEHEWFAKGKKLFGDDFMKWKFKCPMCGNVQSPEDFKKFKDKGATPDSARCECIGRYLKEEERTSALFGGKKVKTPCDYASYGLFRIGHKVKFDSGQETFSFPFAE